MAWLKPRTKQDGTAQYTGMYRDIKNRERSAGTFPSKREALRAAQRRESDVDAGRIADPKRGRQFLAHYVERQCNARELSPFAGRDPTGVDLQSGHEV